MIFTLLILSSAIMAVLMVGTGQVRSNIIFYSFQTLLIALTTCVFAYVENEHKHYILALVIFIVKTMGLSLFLLWLTKRIGTARDTGTFLPHPLAMHLSVLLLIFAQILSCQLPHLSKLEDFSAGGTAGISLILTGILFMLTRRLAISQVLGFLTMENGIFLFALTQASGMPLFVEMGIFLDVFVAVMISGLLIFRIKHSFEHIDVTLLTSLKD
ncbi:hypothetical protein KA183_16710 [bacterium]|nr:hypothetical protein [bacterium]QQR59480.1 MAG: hypothetical protein IPG59_08310 [Candidatus Melainabacteria bacterium]